MRCVLLCAIGLSLSGCSDEGADRKAVYPVTGKITIGGTPIGGANVSFAPRSGQPFARGKTADDGTYKLTTYEWEDGAAEGDYEVLVTKTVSKGGEATSEQEQHASMKAGGSAPSHDGKKGATDDSEGSMINAKYTKKGSGLNAKVDPSKENNFDFDLDP